MCDARIQWIMVALALLVGGPALAQSADVSCLDTALGPKATRLSKAQQDTLLRGHNAARAAVGNGALVWDDTLARHAQGWVDVIAEHNRRKRAGEDLALPGNMGVHSNGSCYSKRNGNRPENIISGSATVEQALSGWIDEEKPHYDPATRNCKGGECRHYLQAVARFVTRIGCGVNPDSSMACSFDTYGARRLQSGGFMDPYEAGAQPAEAPTPPAAEKPAAEKPAAEKPAAEKPAAEKPAAGCRAAAHRVDEATNALGPNRCGSDCDCDGARTCSEWGWCQGQSR